jgi:hypothetical protein
MGDDKAGSAPHQISHGFLYVHLRSGIHLLVASSKISISGSRSIILAIAKLPLTFAYTVAFEIYKYRSPPEGSR